MISLCKVSVFFSKTGSPETIARLLRKRDNVEIFALGVGFKVNNAELKLIASEGAGHVFKIKEYDNFHLMSEIMIKWGKL